MSGWGHFPHTYEWLCGERPFRGGPMELLGQHALTPVLARSDFRSKNRAGSSTVSSSLSTCLLERWSGKGSEGVICDALIKTDIQYNQHNHK